MEEREINMARATYKQDHENVRPIYCHEVIRPVSLFGYLAKTLIFSVRLSSNVAL